MQSVIIKRSIVIAGHKTSVSLENEFWNGLKDIGRSNDMTLSELVGDIDTRRLNGNLSSAIRLFVLGHFRADAAPRGVEIQIQGEHSIAPSNGDGAGHTGR